MKLARMLTSMSVILVAATFANIGLSESFPEESRIILRPGSVVKIEANTPTQVSCEGRMETPTTTTKPYCICKGATLLLMPEKIELATYYSSSSCVDQIKSRPECNRNN